MRRSNTNIRYLPVRRAIGVDISDVSVEMFELTTGPRGSLAASAWSHADVSPGAIRDGEILDAPELVRALRAAFGSARPRPFRTRYAIASLPESRVYLRAFEFPKTLAEDQARRAVVYEAEGVLPLTLDEVYTHALFHRSRAEAHHVLFAAAPRRIIDAYVKALRDAGLVPIAFDVESAALAQSIVGTRPEPVLVADIGGRATVISVVERGEVHSAVTAPVAGDAFTDRVARTLGTAPEEAEARKRAQGIAAAASADVRQALTDALAPLVVEMRRTAQYHELHTGRVIRELLLAGGSARMPGIAEHFAAETHLAVSVGDPWATRPIDFSAQFSDADREHLQNARGAFATVVGLALRGVQGDPAAAGINLLPPALKAPYLAWRRALTTALLGVLVAGATLSLATLVGLTALRRWADVRATAAAADSVRATLGSPRFTDATGTVARVNAEFATLREFQRRIPDVAGLLTRLRERLPPGIAVQEMELRIPSGTDAPITVKLAGRADRRETFLALAMQLRGLPGITQLDSPLANLSLREQATFTVTLTIARDRR